MGANEDLQQQLLQHAQPAQPQEGDAMAREASGTLDELLDDVLSLDTSPTAVNTLGAAHVSPSGGNVSPFVQAPTELRCVGCDLQVLLYKRAMWVPEADTLFFRNYYPENHTERNAPGLTGAERILLSVLLEVHTCNGDGLRRHGCHAVEVHRMRQRSSVGAFAAR